MSVVAAHRQIHRLELVDRGIGHAHRWASRCACGWPGGRRAVTAVARRRKAETIDLYRDHVNDAEARRRGEPIEPRPLTPAEQLPAELR